MSQAVRKLRAEENSPYSMYQNKLVVPERWRNSKNERGPVWDDDVWDLDPFLPATIYDRRAKFGEIINDHFKNVAKEYVFLRLRHGALGARPVSLSQAGNEARKIKSALGDIQEMSITDLQSVTQEALDKLVLKWKSQSVDYALGRVTVIRNLAALGHLAVGDRLQFSPWPGRSNMAVANLKRTKGENSTLRIPEEIISPLIEGSLFYVTQASEDILDARDELERRENNLNRVQRTSVSLHESVDHYFESLKKTNKKVPATPLKFRAQAPDAEVVDGVIQSPSFSAIALMIGRNVRDNRISRYVKEKSRDIGYQNGAFGFTSRDFRGSGVPWIEGFDRHSVSDEISYLRTACWVVIAFLSGMRDSEIRSLTRGCAIVKKLPDGRIRYGLRGRVFKGTSSPQGKKAEWIVLEDVHQAVRILEQINHGNIELFSWTTLNGRKVAFPRKMGDQVERFAHHLNYRFPQSNGTKLIPLEDANGENWRFKPTQFRRTLAWFIANQPFGIIAGKRQYKHSSAVIFEGYAGTSSSNFRQEVEMEKENAKLDYVEELYANWRDGAQLNESRSRKLTRDFERIRRETTNLAGMVVSERRRLRMLKSLARNLHIGQLNDCFFEPSKALCSRHDEAASSPKPMLNACLNCTNAVRKPVHLAKLQSLRDDIEKDFRVIPAERRLQRTILSNQIDAIDNILGEEQT